MKKHKTKIEPMIEEPLPTRIDAEKPQVIFRQVERCEKCDAVNSFRKRSGARKHQAFDQAYAYCCRCGHRVHIRTLHVS